MTGGTIIPSQELAAHRAVKAFDLPKPTLVQMARTFARLEQNRALMEEDDLQEIAVALRRSVLSAIADGDTPDGWLEENSAAIRDALLTKLHGILPADIIERAFPERET